MPMRIKGEDVYEGLRDWIKSDLTDSPRQSHELGKFFFSVAGATIGALGTIEKLNTTPVLDAQLLWSFGFLFVSIWVSLVMVLPKKLAIGGESDLYKEYERAIEGIVLLSYIWFVLWVVGAGIGLMAVRS